MWNKVGVSKASDEEATVDLQDLLGRNTLSVPADQNPSTCLMTIRLL